MWDRWGGNWNYCKLPILRFTCELKLTLNWGIEAREHIWPVNKFLVTLGLLQQDFSKADQSDQIGSISIVQWFDAVYGGIESVIRGASMHHRKIAEAKPSKQLCTLDLKLAATCHCEKTIREITRSIMIALYNYGATLHLFRLRALWRIIRVFTNKRLCLWSFNTLVDKLWGAGDIFGDALLWIAITCCVDAST